MAVFGYGRTSRTEQHPGNHGEVQRRILERAGYELDHWFADDSDLDLPASRHPQFERMLGRIGKRDSLIVCTLDCLGRDARGIVSRIRALGARCGEVVVLQLGAVNLAGPAGEAVLTALAAVADMDRTLPAEPACAPLTAAKPQARTRGRPVCTTQDQRALIIQQHRAGTSISALARAANLSRASIMRIVRATSMQ